MRTELLGQEKNVVRIKVDFEAEEFSKSLKEALDKLSQQANIPGFRKGHAPRKVLEMRFGKRAILNEAMDDLLNNHTKQIIEDYELDLLDNPRLEPCDPQEGEPLSCVVSFEVMPEVELPDIENMEVEKLKAEVPEDILDAAVRAIKKQHAEVHEVDRPVGPEDLVEGDVTVRVLEEGAEPMGPRKSAIDLFEHNTRAVIRDALVGHSKGETVEMEFDIEPENPTKELAGKRVHQTVTIEKISEYILPEMNEEFYKKALPEGVEVHSEEELREWVRKRLLEIAADESRDDAERRALLQITREAKLEVPMLLIRRQADSLRREDEREAQDHYGVSLEAVLGHDDPDWEKKYTNVLMMRARAMVRQSLVVDAIANKYEVTVEKDEVAREIARRAEAYNFDFEALKSRYYKNEDALVNLANDVRFNKTTDLLLTKMKVKEVDKLTVPEPELEEEQPEQAQPETGEGA